MTLTTRNVSDIIIHVITDDPSKIVEALDDADMIRSHGADAGLTTHELMAEYIVHAFIRGNENAPHMKDIIDAITADEEEVENNIIDHLASIQK